MATKQPLNHAIITTMQRLSTSVIHYHLAKDFSITVRPIFQRKTHNFSGLISFMVFYLTKAKHPLFFLDFLKNKTEKSGKLKTIWRLHSEIKVLRIFTLILDGPYEKAFYQKKKLMRRN